MFFNWKNARWLNNFDLIWNKMLFTDLGSPFDDTHMCIYAHVFSKGFCICLKLFPLINFWIFEKLCCCYFRAEIMKQMKNPRKWMRKTSFQLNSEWVCTHVYFIIIRRNEQAHAQTLLFLQHQRFLFVSYTEYVDLFHWTCLYLKDSSVCKWMIHAEGIQKWNFFFRKV